MHLRVPLVAVVDQPVKYRDEFLAANSGILELFKKRLLVFLVLFVLFDDMVAQFDQFGAAEVSTSNISKIRYKASCASYPIIPGYSYWIS